MPPLHVAAEGEEAGAVAVVGAAVAVLAGGPAELAHRQHHDVGHPVAEVGVERGQRPAEVEQLAGELAERAALVGVRVPAVALDERDLDADVGLDELGDLKQRSTDRRAGVIGVVGGLVLRGVGLPQKAMASKDSLAGAVEGFVDGAGVEAFEPAHAGSTRRGGRGSGRAFRFARGRSPRGRDAEAR